MKAKSSTIIAFFLFSMLFVSFLSISVSAFEGSVTKTINLSPIADAYVDSGYPDDKKGDDYYLDIKNYGRSIFIRFDLPSIPVDATNISAQLKLHCRYSSDRANVSAHYVLDDSWRESDITYNNRPTSISNHTTYTENVSPDSWCSWDITEDVVDAFRDNKILTEVLLWENTEDSGYSSFHSKEVEQKYPNLSKYKPMLEIAYTIPTSPATTPLIRPTPTLPPTHAPWWKEPPWEIIGVVLMILSLLYAIYRDRRKS